MKTRNLVAALALVIVTVIAFAGVAAAGETYPPPKPDATVLNDAKLLDADGALPSAQSTSVLNSTAGLPVTGGDVVGLTILGLGAIGAGVAFTTYRRRSIAKISV